MNNTPTPRTDEALCRDMLPAPRAIGWSHGRKVEWMGHNVVTADFARTLERELTAAREELTAVTEQRDRLVTALEKILDYQGRFAEEDPKSIATEALQSIN